MKTEAEWGWPHCWVPDPTQPLAGLTPRSFGHQFVTAALAHGDVIEATTIPLPYQHDVSHPFDNGSGFLAWGRTRVYFSFQRRGDSHEVRSVPRHPTDESVDIGE